MTNKEIFIKEVENTIKDCPDFFSEEALEYFYKLKNTEEKEKPAFTENGIKILAWMREYESQFNNIFKAKDIAEGLFTFTSRAVSGAMRKLITDGYVDRINGNPVCYSLTDNGKTVCLPEAENLNN